MPREWVRVVYNPGITPELEEKASSPLEHPWFTKGQPPVLLSVGRLAPQKDFATLLHAFAKVRKFRTARLMILGEGELRPQLESTIDELGLQNDVSMPGFVENPYAYMKRAAAFAMSSRHEGLPTVMVEALYCGLPVVSTDCPHGPHEILQGGRYGALVPISNPDKLADAMIDVIDGRTPRPPRESWQPYTMESVLDEYVELLAGPEISAAA